MKRLSALLFMASLSSNVHAMYTETAVTAIPRNSSCVRNNQCIVASNHWAGVYNDTNATQTYYVTYRICPQNEDCRSDTYKIIVRPGRWQDGKIMTTDAKYHYTGDFSLIAETTLADANRVPVKTIQNKGIIQVHG